MTDNYLSPADTIRLSARGSISLTLMELEAEVAKLNRSLAKLQTQRPSRKEVLRAGLRQAKNSPAALLRSPISIVSELIATQRKSPAETAVTPKPTKRPIALLPLEAAELFGYKVDPATYPYAHTKNEHGALVLGAVEEEALACWHSNEQRIFSNFTDFVQLAEFNPASSYLTFLMEVTGSDWVNPRIGWQTSDGTKLEQADIEANTPMLVPIPEHATRFNLALRFRREGICVIRSLKMGFLTPAEADDPRYATFTELTYSSE